jgi:hypothetical protein
MRNSPKMTKVHVNALMTAAPTAMKNARRISATVMPNSRTFCW